ncbi:ComEC/Rec2 family competence protein [Peptoclostridium sp. AF21-18]|uniref:ComEC/Rec2 family competence protein n=1 Tax=Peptoclostridium sp. AF21-18 TaxID=2292243 RepID=UPI000E499411|nr:ComEC/Rec2 family competence protein [Peptoclostridium sp. AF21-18]RHQ98732.1 MBL fold metallo-hydrolase [Peptoclostridium sp. AF21-18]
MKSKSLIKIFLLFLLVIYVNGCAAEKLFSVHIIDVGQGDSIFIQTLEDKRILIDAGDEEAEHTVYSYLKRRGVKKIDVLIATHPDTDHIGSMDYIIDKFKISHFYMPEAKTESEAFYNLLDSCRDKNLKIEYLTKGDVLKIDGSTTMEILSPSTITDKNNLNSIVSLLNYKGYEFLFTGDAEKENESEILSSCNLPDIEFLKAGHHGSSSSSTDEFIEKLKPEAVAISCGYNNDYGHPHRSVLDTFRENGSVVYRTDKNGSLVFYCDENGIFTKKKYKTE